MQQRVSDAHSNVKNLSSTEAKLQYIRTWEALPEHGTHYFIAKFRGARKPELIAVAYNRLMKVNNDNGEVTKTWRFSSMKKWHVNWEIRHIKVCLSTLRASALELLTGREARPKAIRPGISLRCSSF